MKKVKMFSNKAVQDIRAVKNLSKNMRELGGILHFTIRTDLDGWMAVCNEADGIVTGGINPNPDDFEIESQIREAIYTAFDVKIKIKPEILKTSVSELTLSLA